MDYELEIKESVVADFDANKSTVGQISRKYGVPVGTIYRWVRERNAGTLTESHRGVYIKKVDEEVKRKIIEMYSNKTGIAVIGKELGLSPMSVKKWLQKLGVYAGMENAKDNQRKLSNGDIEKLLKLYTDTVLPVREIAKECGVSEQYARRLVEKNGIRKQGRKRSEHPRTSISKSGACVDSVITDHNTGLYTHRNLAEKYKVSTRTISRILSAAGLKAIGCVPQTPSHVVAQLREGVLADLAGGRTVYEVAELHGIPVDTVERIAAGGKVSEDAVAGEPDGKDVGVEDRVVSLHEGGRKMTEIAGELGLTAYAVRKVLVERGIDTRMVHADRPSGTKSGRVREDVLAAHNEGLGASDIARRCGVSIPTVRKVLRGAGVVPHKHTVEAAGAGPVEVSLPVLTPYMRGRLLEVWDESRDLERAARSIMVDAVEARALLEAEGRTVR